MTENITPEKVARVEQVGPDRVTVSEHEVVIETRRPMPDWQVRELNPPPIYFEDKKYYLVEQRPAESRNGVRYVLLPWPEGMFTASKNFYTYDAESVAERDGACRQGRLTEITHALLMPLYPLLGLLWSGVQKRLNRLGFTPHSISGVSIFTVFCLLFAQGVFAVVTIQATARTGKMLVGGMLSALSPVSALHLGALTLPIAWLDILMVAAFLVDVAIRYSLYLHEGEWFGGFLEWVVRRAPRNEDSLDESPRLNLRPNSSTVSASQSDSGSSDHLRLQARLSFLIPATATLMCVGVYSALKGTGGSTAHMLLVYVGWFLGAALIGGVGLSTAALSGVRRHGCAQGVLLPALAGLGLSVLMLLVFVGGFVKGFRNAQLLARARVTSRQVNAELRQDMTNANANSVEARQASVEKLRGALDTVSKDGTGETSLIAKVSSQHLAKLQALMNDYRAAFNALKNPPVLEMNGVTAREQLLARKVLVQKFVAANDKLQTFITTQIDSYREDLRAAGVTSAGLTAALASYEKNAAPQRPLVLKIRQDDQAMGNAMLAMLDILEKNWGMWTYNAGRKKVDFQDAATLDNYLDSGKALRSAARDQQAQQVKMASLMN